MTASLCTLQIPFSIFDSFASRLSVYRLSEVSWRIPTSLSTNSPTLTALKVSWRTQKYGLLLYELYTFYVQISFGNKHLNLISFVFNFQILQVLGESMAGISQHCKTGDVVAFGESVGVASKALCGLTEAAGQV